MGSVSMLESGPMRTSGGGGKSLVDEELVDSVYAALRSAADQTSGRRPSNKKVVESLFLLIPVTLDDLLLHFSF